MRTRIYMTAKNGDYDAEATYADGIVVVKAGSRIRLDFAAHIRGGKKALSYRNDRAYVDDKGIVLKDCTFTSSSTAAQFVTGRSTNGLESWHIDPKKKLKDFLAAQ